MILCADRHITHLDLDTFFVSVEYLRNTKLKGKPILIGGKSDRGVVAACSYEARRFGIQSGMPMRTALRLCSHATVIKSDFEAYSKYSRLVTDVIRESVPLFEKASIDEFYVDLTGMDKHFGCKIFSDGLKTKVVKETGLSISYGLAANKLVSKVATGEVKPDGQIQIPFGDEKSFLAPLTVTKMPGIGKETGYKLLKMGVETIKTLSEIPAVMLQNMLGKTGLDLHRKAQGIDESPVVPYREQKGIGTEHTFETDTIDVRFLQRELVRMTESVAFELRSQNRLAGCVIVKVRYSDFETHTAQASIDYTAADHLLLHTAKELFTKLYNRRQLVRLVGVRLTDLIAGTYQVNLFDDTQELISLYRAIDSVKKQFGEKFLMRASGAEQKKPELVAGKLFKAFKIQ